MAFIEIPSHENVLFLIIATASFISMWSLVEQATKIKLSWEIASVFVFVTCMAGLLIVQASMPRTTEPQAQINRLLEIAMEMMPFAIFGLIMTVITLFRLIGYLYRSMRKALKQKQSADKKMCA